jgi:hypothetical protein
MNACPAGDAICALALSWIRVRSSAVISTIRTGEHAFYRCCPPTSVPLATLTIGVAGRRWTIDESIQAGKGLAGLDEDQVRR